MSKNFLSSHRKWNTLYFRGRLMSLLVLTHSGVSPRPHLPQESRISALYTLDFFILVSSWICVPAAVIVFRAGVRFPRVANDPPRANALRGLIEAFYPAGVSCLHTKQ